MSFVLAEPPGFTDVPESQIVADQSVMTGFLMSAIKDNCAAGTVMPEFDQGYYSHGQTVRPFVSKVDQYAYSPDEVMYVWETMNTTNMQNGLPSANGGLLWLRHYVDQATGLVNCETYYYVPGGAGAPTNDGVLTVTTIGVRGKQLRKMTAQIAGALTAGAFIQGERIIQTSTGATAYVDPGSSLPGGGFPLTILAAAMGAPDATHLWTGQSSGATYTPTALPSNAPCSYTDLGAAAFDVDAAMKQTITRELARNSKLSTVRTECFLMNPSNAPIWKRNQSITAGALMQPTGRWANGCWYVAANNGVTGLIEPGPWPSAPNNTTQVQDGSVIWNIAGAGFTFGQEVPLPVSPFDGYEYSQAEIYAVMPFFYTTLAYPKQKGVSIVWTSGKGDMRDLSKNITSTAPVSPSQLPNGTQPADETGATVYTNWNFGITPPAEVHEPALAAPGTPTVGCGFVYNTVWFSDAAYSDGSVHVMVVACRALGAPMNPPGGANFVDFTTDDVLSGATLPNPVAQNINENAKFAILRPEVSMQFTTGPGTIVPVSPSPWDTYAYGPSECQYLYWWTNIGAAAGSLRDFIVEVDPQSGVVCTRVDYFRSGAGFSWPLTFGLITLGSDVSIATAMYGFPGSPVYSNMPSGGPWGIPNVNVAVLQSRLHETELQGQQIVLGTSTPAPPGPGNLIPNGGFEIQRIPGSAAVAMAGTALDWYVDEDIGTTAFLEEAGLAPGSNFAQGVGAQCSGATLSGRSTNAVNRGSFVDTIIPIDPNGTYQFQFLAKASPLVINYGFYCRVHLFDENVANDTQFDLLWPTRGASDELSAPGTGLSDNPGSPLSTGVVTAFGPFIFAIPQDGDGSVQTGFGKSVLHQNGTPVTLGFIPAYLGVEFDLFSPTDTSFSGGAMVLFAIVDNAILRNVTGLNVQPVNSAQQLVSAATLSQVGTSTVIDISASALSFPNKLVNYNAGSVDPGAYGTFFIYAIDPNYNGGAVTFLATQNQSDLSSQNGIVVFGSIATLPAGGGSGGGGTNGGTAVVITTKFVPDSFVGISYSKQLIAFGGVTPYTWSLVGSGSLPSGIGLSSSGLVSGTTVSTGFFPFTVQATDSSSPTQSAMQSFVLYVS
jgi:hypothetical protein